MDAHHLFMIILFGTVLLCKPVTTLLHELGHAVPAFILTGQKVILYIGSYGNQKSSFRIPLHIFDIWLTKNPLRWYKGMCIPTATNVSINKQIIYILSGPCSTFIIAFLAAFSAFNFDLHPLVKFAVVVLVLSSILDLLINLSPSDRPIALHNGNFTYNDGTSLKRLFRYRKHATEFELANKLYIAGDFQQASLVFEGILNKGLKDRTVYRYTISSLINAKAYPKAKNIWDVYMQTAKMDADDYVYAGIIELNTGSHENSILYFDQALKSNPKNLYALNGKGYAFTLMKKYEESIPLFDLVLTIDAGFSYAFNNRGFAKLYLGDLESGYHDIMKSIELAGENAYSFRNLGIYYLKKDNKPEALNNFQKAKELDATTEMIDELISQAEN